MKALQDRLTKTCNEALVVKGIDDTPHQERLKTELKECDAQNEYGYFLDLHDKKVRYSENEHNLLIPFLLGLVNQFDISKPPAYSYGEFPDIDVDYLPIVREYLKNDWAPKQYGQEFVCNIGSYNTFGIKSSLQDMARVFSKNRQEIVDLTTSIGLKDEDGKALTWDKALEIHPALKAYCETNPEVAEAAKRLLNRNRSMGKHAGGLIVSSKPIDALVPLVKGKDGSHVSAWVEGLHGQDLGPMGLVKFDLLVITNILQIALACRLIKERHPEIKSISCKEGKGDWTDIKYLNDPKALDMASRGDLKCIFQFDSEGIRTLAKDGGVDTFDDLVAYTALYRPGPLGMKMQEHYIARKRGREPYEIHPVLQPILGKTYGVLCYQEQVMQVLNVVGDIPLKDCEILRKAISKKKEDYFGAYRKMFIENGQRILGWKEEEVSDLWNQIAAFAEYGFNLSHACAYTYISSRLLYLKAHYPLEFFTAILMCEDLAEKIKEYKIEAKRNGVEIKPLHLNNSGVNFRICAEAIYYGFVNIKGIGKEVAEKIVQGQPYLHLPDFLERCGTEAKVLKPLCGLKLFGDDPVRSYKHYEWHKDQKKKRVDKDKRLVATLAKQEVELRALVPDEYQEYAKFDMIGKLLEVVPEGTKKIVEGRANPKDPNGFWEVRKEIAALVKKRINAIQRHATKLDQEKADPPKFQEEEVEIDEAVAKVYSSPELIEQEFYGFIWTHQLEKLGWRTGDDGRPTGPRTFEDFRVSGHQTGYVDIRVANVEAKTSKKGNVYHLLTTEDAHGEVGFVQVWSDDWPRWEPEFKRGNLLRMKIKAPDGNFKRYTFDSPLKHLRDRVIPRDKGSDTRVIVLKKVADV
jgi:DNA polymerase III alpha subunit